MDVNASREAIATSNLTQFKDCVPAVMIFVAPCRAWFAEQTQSTSGVDAKDSGIRYSQEALTNGRKCWWQIPVLHHDVLRNFSTSLLSWNQVGREAHRCSCSSGHLC
jgi:hypothetical protein